MLPEDMQAIEDLALKLLLAEAPEDRRQLLYWAQDQMQEVWGIDPHVHPERGPHQGVHDLTHAPGLTTVMNARGIIAENVLGAEDFEDLILRLVPGSWDDG